MLTKEELAKIEERYAVKSRDWLGLALEYEGQGEAEFSTNPGVIRGPTSVRYREDGSRETFEMTVEEIAVDQQTHGPDASFTFVHALPVPGDPQAFGFGPTSNSCTRVEVTSVGLHIRAAQRSDVLASAGNDRVTFRPYRTIATFDGETEPHFWVAPLLNFTSGFAIEARQLRGHPLRVRVTNAYQAAAGEADFYHQHAYQRGNALIPFRCEGELGFIEPLIDYTERAARVEAGETLVTAAMVGRVRNGLNPDVDDEWFPPDLVTLLSLATGRAVGVPFVELRGSSGELVARLHARIGTPSSARRRNLLEEAFDRSTGALLSALLEAEHRDRPWLRVALRHLLRAFTGDMTVEDQLSHLFRVVEGLSAGLKLNHARPLELSDGVREQVMRALETCVEEFEAISSAAATPDRERVWGLKGRLKDIEANRPSFPTQLLELATRAGLPDAMWLRDFNFRTGLSGETRSWASAAGVYRNRIFHSGFIDFEKYDLDNAVAFISHLSDVLVRVVFELIGFDGQYKPPCGAYGAATHERPEWAKPEVLSAELLRYVE